MVAGDTSKMKNLIAGARHFNAHFPCHSVRPGVEMIEPQSAWITVINWKIVAFTIAKTHSGPWVRNKLLVC